MSEREKENPSRGCVCQTELTFATEGHRAGPGGTDIGGSKTVNPEDL